MSTFCIFVILFYKYSDFSFMSNNSKQAEANVNVRVSKELKKRLRLIAAQREVNMSTIVIKALHEYLDKNDLKNTN